MGHGLNAERIAGQYVTPNLFPMLGVKPLHGRFPTDAENAPGAGDVAVLGFQYWRSAFGADPGAVGQTLMLDGIAHEIVGVAPRGFTGVELERIDVWTPLFSRANGMGAQWSESRGWLWLRAIGRLAPDADAVAVAERATARHREGRGEWSRYDPEARILLGSLIAARGLQQSSDARVALWLTAVAALVLLIACANVANILLAQATTRQRDIGVRLALGISRRRLLTQLLFESIVLACLGGVAALAIGHWGGVLVRASLLPNVHWPANPVDVRLFVFTFVAAAAAGVVSGLIPAIGAARSDVVAVLGGGSTRGIAGDRSRVRTGMLLLQTTLSVVLLVVAGLFVKSLANLNAVDLGFDHDGLIVVIPEIDEEVVAADEAEAFYERSVERLAQLGIVAAATRSSSIPFYSASSEPIDVPGMPEPPTFSNGGPYVHLVDADYFQALGIRVIRGRGIEAADDAGSQLVAVVEERMADAYWPDVTAIGSCLKIGGEDAPCSTVVGIVEDAARQSITLADEAQYYIPLAQHEVAPTAMFVRLRGPADSAALVALQREVTGMSEGVRYTTARPLARYMDWQTRSWELGASMFSIFGTLALVIAAVGLYAVMAFSVVRRTREIGIRSALGARPAALVGMVLARAVALVAISLVAGTGVAPLMSRWIQPLLLGVDGPDFSILSTVVVVQLLVGVVAAAIPGVRAAKVDAAIALRAS